MHLLEFWKFIMETTTTPQEKDMLRTIINSLIANNKDWLKEQSIMVGDKGQYWILNYMPGPRTEYNKLTRGMVVQKPTPTWNNDPLALIKSFPFTRFFNQHEKEAAKVDVTNSEMLEKMDGCLAAVFFPTNNPNDPHFHTRKMISTHQNDINMKITGFHGKEYQLMPLIKQYVNNLNFDKEDLLFTYIFEFIHDATTVLTKYNPQQYGLYLLGGRNLKTHHELTEIELDEIAKKIHANRPRRWDSSKHHDKIMDFMKDIAKETPDFEGFVFRDKITGNRVKIKDPDYVKLHHILGSMSYKNLIVKVLEDEADEIISYFPSAKEKVEKLKTTYDNYLNKTVEIVKHWRDQNLDRKSLAIKIFMEKREQDDFIRSQIMKFFQEPNDAIIKQNIDNNLKEIAIGKGKNAGSPDKLLDIIKLKDEEDVKQDVGEL